MIGKQSCIDEHWDKLSIIGVHYTTRIHYSLNKPKRAFQTLSAFLSDFLGHGHNFWDAKGILFVKFIKCITIITSVFFYEYLKKAKNIKLALTVFRTKVRPF